MIETLLMIIVVLLIGLGFMVSEVLRYFKLNYQLNLDVKYDIEVIKEMYIHKT